MKSVLRSLALVAALASSVCSAQFATKIRTSQVYCSTNGLSILTSNDLTGDLILIDSNLVLLTSQTFTTNQLVNLVVQQVNDSVQTLIYSTYGDFLTNNSHAYNQGTVQSFYSYTNRSDAGVLGNFLVGGNVTISGTVASVGSASFSNLTAYAAGVVSLGVTNSLTVGSNGTFVGSVFVNSNLVVLGGVSLSGMVSSLSVSGGITTVSGTISQGTNNTGQETITNRIINQVAASTVQISSNLYRYENGVSFDVAPSWRMVYSGKTTTTNPTVSQSFSGGFSYTSLVTGTWSWTNLFVNTTYITPTLSNAFTTALPGLYRVHTYSSSERLMPPVTANIQGSYTGVAISTNNGATWTFGSHGHNLTFGTANGTSTFVPTDEARTSFLFPLPAGVVVSAACYEEVRMDGTSAQNNFKFFPLFLHMFVEYMPCRTSIIGGAGAADSGDPLGPRLQTISTDPTLWGSW